ncbi:MAG: DUF5693 family protein [Atribacterota bacterium]|nr:DUF5693 family protein [Atribacterota bacterium]
MKFNYKYIFIFFILISIIVSLIISVQRINLEKNFKQIELVISLNKVRELSLKENYNENELLTQFKSKGITSIAIHEDTIESLLAQGRIAFLAAKDLIEINLIHDLHFFNEKQITAGQWMIVSRDYFLIKRIEDVFRQNLSNVLLQKNVFSNEDYCLLVSGNEDIIKMGLNFSNEDIKKIQELDYNVILRPKNPAKINSEILQHKLSYIEKLENISAIIFDEEEVLGYPSERMILETSQFMQNKNMPFGIIEFTSQKGIQNIADNIGQLSVRVHSITSEEMEKISPGIAVDRWIRAAQERNIRIFYLNPFLKTRTDNLIQYNLDYIESITSNLIQKKYTIGQASLLPSYQTSNNLIILIGLGIISAGLLLLIDFFDIFKKYSIFLFIVSLLFFILTKKVMGEIFLIKILSLISAVVFPVLAIIKNKKYLINYSINKKNNLMELIKNILFGISGIMLISLIGGIISGALLTDYKFMLAIQLFSGVKIAYILPLALVAFYFWWVSKIGKKDVFDDFKKPILFEHAFLAAILLIFGVIYIARSGNFSFLPVPVIEEKMRLFLENTLIARPRNKEFLIGYPLISIAIAMNYFNFQYTKILFIIMGTVAPVTIINTFCHVHTPFYFSLLRTFNGFWLGIIISILLGFIFFIAYDRYRKRVFKN